MTDEYVVVVTTDEILVSDIQNATTMDVIHVSNHDKANEQTYRHKIVVLDTETVTVTQQDLSTWHENADYTIAILKYNSDDFMGENQENISDVWYKPLNPVLIEKRLSTIEKYLRTYQGISEYVAFISTELKNPIANINGYSDVLLSGKYLSPLTKQQHKFTSIVKDNGLRLLNMVNDIRDWTAIKYGNFQLYFEMVDINSLLDELSNKKAYDVPHTDETLHKFELEASEDLSLVLADHIRMLQVIETLLFCAERAESRYIKVRVWYADEKLHVIVASEKEFVYVHPNGFDLWTPFAGDVIKRIIELHGGTIFAETTPNTGSTFHFTIPIAKDSNE